MPQWTQLDAVDAGAVEAALGSLFDRPGDGPLRDEIDWMFGPIGTRDPATGDPKYPAGPTGRELYGSGQSLATPNLVTCHRGDPVDCATGNFTESQDDLAVGGLGALELSRTYNAKGAVQAAGTGRFGRGWSDPFGQRLVFDADLDAVDVVTADGSVVSFYARDDGRYDCAPWVQAVLGRNGDGSYDYALPDRSSLHFSAAGRLLELRDRNDNPTTLHYDGAGNVTDATAPGGRSIAFAYNADGTVASAISTGGREVHYGYASEDLTSVTTVRGGVWHFTYDAQHRLTQIADPRGGHTTNSYDSQDRVVAQTDRMGHDTTWTYTDDTTRVTDPLGHVTEMIFTNNLPTQIVTAKGTAVQATKSIAYDKANNPITVTDPRFLVWRYGYDAGGNRTSATDPLDRVTRWTYDGQRDVLSQTLPSGLATSYGYDTHGNVTSVTRPLSASQDQTTTLDYDAEGNLTARTDPLGHAWSYSYNAHGDLTSATSPLGHETSYTHDDDGFVSTRVSPRGDLPGADPADFTTTYVRNEDGQPTTITDPLGHDTLFGYDPNGNLTSTTDADGRETQTTFDAADQPIAAARGDGSTQHTAYDENGLVISQTDGEGHQTTYARDAQGRVASVTDPLQRRTSYLYDLAGNRIAAFDPQGRRTSYLYDIANQLWRIMYESGHPGDVALTYTADGLRSTMSDDTGTSRWSYDALDRLTSTQDGQGQTVGYHYDLANRLTSIGYPDALVPGPPTQPPDTVDAGTVARGYDADDRLTSVADWLGDTTTFAYNADDALTAIERPDGTTATHTVDRDDRLIGIDDTGAHYGYSVDYTRTAAGLLASASETGDGAAPDAIYSHDDAARLVSSGTSNQSYTYDDADNLTQLTDAATTRKQTFDAAGQLTAITDTSNQPLAHFDYDPQGNRTALTPTTSAATSYSYDQASQLTQYQGPDATGAATITQTYGYDGDGLRQYTQLSGARTHHTWDRSGGLPLMIQDGATSYLTGPGGLVIEQITAAGQARYYHRDQLGSTRALTDHDGQPVATYTYTPYGAPQTTTGSATNPFRYAGQYTDPTGLQYLRARYHDPTTGQFLTRDPLETATRQPYAYAAADPTDLVDLTGQFPGLPSFQQIADTAAGVGDALTFGGTKAIRGLIGSDGTNYCSGSYRAGQTGGLVAGAAVGAVGAARAIAAARAAAAAGASAEAAESAGVVFRANTGHIFRAAPGHLAEDTAANRALLEGAVKPENLVGTRGPGGAISVYRQLLPDGRQVWVELRNGREIANGGVNTVPR